jgi:hypothetical protein
MRRDEPSRRWRIAPARRARGIGDNMLYVIRNLGTDKCVARFGGEHSYTNNLQQAQTFLPRVSTSSILWE